MKEPICIVCGSREGCDTVQFRKTQAGEEFERRKWKGHHPDVEWFCQAHIGPARAFSHLTLAEALESMKE